MNRRKFFVLGSLGLGAFGGYFGWRWYQSPTIPDGMSVDTLHLDRDVLTENASRERDSTGWKEQYHEVIKDAETAAGKLVETTTTGPFIDDTDFEGSYLILVQNWMQSEMELVVESISRIENGLHLHISIDAPVSAPDDLTTHSVLIRITDEQGDIPEEVTVDITGYV